jgi:phosphatidylglycerol:prolipoprotein diacylglycerol transferase
MITISIDPILFSIGHFHLRWYSLIVLAAASAGLWLIAREADRKGFPKDGIFDIAIWVFLGGLVGARLFHVIDHWPDVFSKDPGRILAIWEGGLAIWGAVVGGFVPLALLAWRRGWHLPRLLDAFAPGLVLGQAIGRVACVITGDAMGKPTSGPIGFAYSNPEAMVPQLGVYYTPTPVFEIVLNLSILALLWRLRSVRWPDGALFLVYLILYSLGRFGITFWSSYREFFLGLNQAQVVSLVMLAIALPLLGRMVLRTRQSVLEA